MIKSLPKELQRQHWSRRGSISACIGLLTHHLQHDKKIPSQVRESMQNAVRNLRDTYILEGMNNEFISPKQSALVKSMKNQRKRA